MDKEAGAQRREMTPLMPPDSKPSVLSTPLGCLPSTGGTSPSVQKGATSSLYSKMPSKRKRDKILPLSDFPPTLPPSFLESTLSVFFPFFSGEGGKKGRP